MTDNIFIATFLKAELDSIRFGHNIQTFLVENNLNQKLILEPNLENEIENSVRLKVLDSYRTFTQRQGLFEDFPESVLWIEEIWTMEQVLDSLYIAYDYWDILSDNTRSPLIAAQNIKKGKIVYGQNNYPILRFLDINDIVNFENMIFVKKENDPKSVIIEGHSRATIYALNPKIRPEQLTVLVGYSPNMDKWSCF